MDRELFSLNGKVAVVTGASRGIGGALASALAHAGAAVALLGRDAQALSAAQAATIGRWQMAATGRLDQRSDLLG